MNISYFKKLLQDKEQELLADIARLEVEAQTSGGGEVRDEIDDATSSQGASEALEEGTLASRTLIQVQDALRRIEAGTYGACAICGRPIEEARLRAVPWAEYCLEDQEKLDREAHLPVGGPAI